LGGSTYQRAWPDAVLQLACLPILLLALSQVRSLWEISSLHRAALATCGVIVALPILQLMPLPPAMWTALPGREPIEAGFQEAGIALHWMPVSLSPSETWRSALGLLPPFTVFLCAIGLDRASRRRLVLVLLAIGLLSLMVGMAQVSAGTQGLFRFYGPSSEATGFFINRNHYAALLYAMIPFTAAWVVGLTTDRRPQFAVGVALNLVLLACLMLGLGMARSRAGLLLTLLACTASLGLAGGRLSAGSDPLARRLISVAGFAGLVLILQFAAIGLLQRLASDPLDDERWQYAVITFRAALDFFPFGSGFGTFDSIFKSYETNRLLQESYLNNAHNDYAELLLEGGAPALATLALLLGVLLHAVSLGWKTERRSQSSALDSAIRRAAGIVACLLLLHSIVDYPLRSAALATVFALSCALLIPSPTEELRKRRGSSRSRAKRSLDETRVKIGGAVAPDGAPGSRRVSA
jgi:hypothetical protein